MPSLLTKFLDLVFNAAAGIFLLRLIFDEVSPGSFNKIVILVRQITEPVLVPIRKILPNRLKDKLYVDISPIIAFLLIIGLKFLIIKMLPLLFSKLSGGISRSLKSK